MSHYGYLDHSALAHHGVKGMKWGIRKQKARRIISNIKTFTKSKHGKRALATGAAIGAVSGGAIGTMIGVSKLKQKKDMEKLRAADAEEWLRRNGMLFEPDYFEYDKFQHSALMHHGIKGMKWGVRRYQNPDGSLTPEGMRRYDIAGNLLGGNNNHVTNADTYNLLRDTSYGMMKRDYKHGVKNGGNRRELRKDYKIAKKSVDSQMRKVYGDKMADAADKKYKREKAATIASASGLALFSLATAAALGKKGYDKYKYKHPTYSYNGQKTKNFSDYMDMKYGKINHSELYHHGIKGMKWGIRRYQNPDGSLTPEGEKRYYSYEGAKRAKAMSRAGVALGLGSGAVSIASMMGQAIHEDKLPEDIKNSKSHKAKAAAGVTASGIGGIAGMTSGMLLQAKSDSMLDKIIKNSSKEEFDKIKNDKRFANNSMVKTRAHFDNFEKLNKITKNMSNKQKAEIYVKNEFKKKNKYWTPDDSEGAWYNAKLAGNWYGLSDKEMEKLCWKYEKQNNPDFNH